MGSNALTKDVAHPFVAGLKQDEQVLDQHPERKHRVLVPEVVVVELANESVGSALGG
jgi:hypothetical protein